MADEFPGIHQSEGVQEIKASAKAPLGSRERAKDILDSVSGFMQAITEDLAVDEWIRDNLAFVAFTKVAAKYIPEASKEKARKTNSEVRESLILFKGSKPVLLEAVSQMLESIAEKDAEEMFKESLLFNLMGGVIPLPPEVEQKAKEMTEELAKIQLLKKLSVMLGVGAEIGVMDKKTKEVHVVHHSKSEDGKN